MPRTDFRSPRLHVDAPLASGVAVALTAEQANYLANVLRLTAGDQVLVFNGREGEWRATLSGARKGLTLVPSELTRAQSTPGDLHLAFAPLKHARLDYMVQKAVEMGASRLQPVLTRHTQVSRVNVDRMRANVVEAAEQCGVLSLPEVGEPARLDAYLASLSLGRVIVFCDEHADVSDPLLALEQARSMTNAVLPHAARPGVTPLALLIGPEGGFSDDERAAVFKLPNVVRLALGPRILRADTAAVAALAVVQAVVGDWR